MKKETLEDCIKLCREFEKRAKLVISDEQAMKYQSIGFGTAGTGALRRTSMELTRRLADLRQGR